MLDRQICRKCRLTYMKSFHPPINLEKIGKDFDIAWEDHAKVFCHQNPNKKDISADYYKGASWIDIRYSPPKECDFILEQIMKAKA